jgi:hypothetical protein
VTSRKDIEVGGRIILKWVFKREGGRRVALYSITHFLNLRRNKAAGYENWVSEAKE